jgi:hypothetical protein
MSDRFGIQEERNRNQIEPFGKDCEGVEIHGLDHWILENVKKNLSGEIQKAGRM